MYKLFCDICGKEITPETSASGVFRGLDAKGKTVELVIRGVYQDNRSLPAEICSDCAHEMVKKGK